MLLVLFRPTRQLPMLLSWQYVLTPNACTCPACPIIPVWVMLRRTLLTAPTMIFNFYLFDRKWVHPVPPKAAPPPFQFT